ncbi:MAG TPA: phosphatase PAP2-related protein [Opitutaceae bacterium]|jgi:hypothetical protein
MGAWAQAAVRAGFVAAALVLWFWTQRLIGRKAAPADGIGDRLHELTAGMHAWLSARPAAANALLVATSALIDLFGLYLLGAAVFGPTTRPFVALILVMGARQVCQGLTSLPAPKGIIWRDPGVPSLLVTYGVSNDFFFSGHTATAVLGAMELARQGPPWLGAAAAVVATAEMAAVVILRAHYFVDVFAAVFVTWGCDVLAARAAPWVDACLHAVR